RKAARLDRRGQVSVLVDLRRGANLGDRRHAGQGRGVVRQRVGLFQSSGRSRSASTRPGAAARLSGATGLGPTPGGATPAWNLVRKAGHSRGSQWNQRTAATT